MESIFGKKELKLFKAIHEGDEKHVKKLLKNDFFSKPANIDAISPNGNNAFQEAVINEKLIILEIFLEIGADIDSVWSNTGDTAVNYAMKKRKSKLLQFLVNKGAKVEQAEINALLISSMLENNLDMVKFLVNKVEQAEINALLISSISMLGNNLDMVKFLVNKVVTLEQTELTALLVPSMLENNLDIVKFLVNKGARIKQAELNTALISSMIENNFDADIRWKDNKEKSAFEYAVSLGNSEILKELINVNKNGYAYRTYINIEKCPPLFLSILAKDDFYFKVLVKESNLETKYEDESIINFALKVECQWFINDWLKYIITNSNIDINDNNNEYNAVPMYYASSIHNAEVVKILLKHGADLFLKTVGDNVLNCLFDEFIDEKTINIVIDHIDKVNFSKELFSDMFVFHLAGSKNEAINQDKLIISILNTNPEKFKEYYTSLWSRNSPEITRIILKNGLDPNAIYDEKYSKTILNALIDMHDKFLDEMASWQNTKKLFEFALWKTECLVERVELFLQFGANPKKIGGINNFTALERAISLSAVKIVKTILEYDPKVVSIGDPLFCAVNACCNPEIVKLLIDHKIDIKKRGNKYWCKNLTIFDYIIEKRKQNLYGVFAENLVNIEEILSRYKDNLKKMV